MQPVAGSRDGGLPPFERRQGDRRRGQESGTRDPGQMRALSREIIDSTVEASRALFAAREKQNPNLLRRAVSAYGCADVLDRAGPPPSRRVTI